MRECDLEKLMKLGVSIYRKENSVLLIRKLQPDGSWRAIKRCRVRAKLEESYNIILRDPMSIGI